VIPRKLIFRWSFVKGNNPFQHNEVCVKRAETFAERLGGDGGHPNVFLGLDKRMQMCGRKRRQTIGG